jgi:hypothetical protein
MKAITRIARGCLAVAVGLLFWGCAGSGSDQAPKLSATGQHPAGWLSTHFVDYAKTPDQCATCHGSAADPNSTGGTSGISCASCHGGGIAHPAGWNAGLAHGRLGAQAAATASTGLASCARCHGSDYRGGVSASSCYTCHSAAPHAPAPWLSATPGTNSSHDATNVGNAPACFVCHAATVQPVPAQAPGCYNNTMCHGVI